MPEWLIKSLYSHIQSEPFQTSTECALAFRITSQFVFILNGFDCKNTQVVNSAVVAPLRCPDSGFQRFWEFNQKSHLKSSKAIVLIINRTMSGQAEEPNPRLCLICQKTFASSSSKKVHVMVVHEVRLLTKSHRLKIRPNRLFLLRIPPVIDAVFVTKVLATPLTKKYTKGTIR